MRRFGLTLSIAASLGIAALIASCSGDGTPISSPDGSVPGLSSADLNGGGWTPSVAAAANNDGKVTVCHSGNGKNFTQITVSPQGARAHLGDPSTGKGGHAGDFRVSDLTTCPPSSTPGQVQVCKVAGPGVNVGASYAFTVTTTGTPQTVNVTAGAAPAGNCVNAGTFAVGTNVTIAEGAQTGVTTSSIVVSPSGAQQGTSDLTNRSAAVIAGNGTTRVTFTNTTGTGGTSGTLVVCKVGGAGVNAGTNFTFSVAGQNVTVAAGAAPNGTCSSAITLPTGSVIVNEASSAGTITQSIAGSPTPTNIFLAGRSAQTLITAGQQSTITYTNVAATTANSGSLVICKVAGTGVTAGTSFSFDVAGQSISVNAGAAPNGTCSSPITLPLGTLAVTETAKQGTSVSAITGSGGGVVGGINLAGRTANVTIAANQQTTITFTNTAP